MAVTIILALSLFGLGVSFFYSSRVKKIAVDMGIEDPDVKARLVKIHAAIAGGAMAFLKQEYKFMAIFIVVFGAIECQNCRSPQCDSRMLLTLLMILTAGTRIPHALPSIGTSGQFEPNSKLVDASTPAWLAARSVMSL